MRQWRMMLGTLLVASGLVQGCTNNNIVAPSGSGPKASASGPAAMSPVRLPGRGLAQHDFMYAGESQERRIFIVRKGKVVWNYDDPGGKGEVSDAVLLSNGNLLYAHQFGIKLISPEKKTLWSYDVPAGHEVHTAVPIGKDRVLYIQNGDPALLRVVNIVTGRTEKEIPLSVKHPESVHGQFRHARLTDAGTLLVAHMDRDEVVEYDSDGKILWTFSAPTPWGVTPLSNGNVLVTDRLAVREVTRGGQTVWSVGKTELPGYKIANLQQAWRLPSGNTVINNWDWANAWTPRSNDDPGIVQAIELSPSKKVLWALRSWEAPADLGPSTTIQFLDATSAAENVHFGPLR